MGNPRVNSWPLPLPLQAVPAAAEADVAQLEEAEQRRPLPLQPARELQLPQYLRVADVAALEAAGAAAGRHKIRRCESVVRCPLIRTTNNADRRAYSETGIVLLIRG